MPHHIIDLTESSATTPVPPRPQPSAAGTSASTTKRPPSNVDPASDDSETMKRLVLDTIKSATNDRLCNALEQVLDKNALAVERMGTELLVPEEKVKPWKEGDDDLGNSDCELPQESSEDEEDEEQEEKGTDVAEESDTDDSSDFRQWKNGAARGTCKLCMKELSMA